MTDSAPNSPPVLPPGVDLTPLETTAKLITVHLFLHLFDHLKPAPSDERPVFHDPLLDHPPLRLKKPSDETMLGHGRNCSQEHLPTTQSLRLLVRVTRPESVPPLSPT